MEFACQKLQQRRAVLRVILFSLILISIVQLLLLTFSHVNRQGIRQSGAVYLSVFFALFFLNDERWGRETEYKVSYFLECF